MVCGATIISTCAFCTTHILNVLDDVVLLLLYTNVSHVRFRTKHDIRYTSPSLWMFINLLDFEKRKSKIEKTTCHVDILCTLIILLRHLIIIRYINIRCMMFYIDHCSTFQQGISFLHMM